MIRPTTIIEVHIPELAASLGTQSLMLASETSQHTGSFKFRAAWHLVAHVKNTHIITASSGNFGQALAYACQIANKRCTVVMPDTSARVKIEAVQGYGATVEFIDVNTTSRSQRLDEIARDYPDAYVASPYDEDLVIAGNSTLGHELAALDLD